MAYQNPDAVAAGAPPWHLPAPQPRPTAGGIRGFAWALWPWMSWILPVFFAFHGFLGSGGWGTLLLTFASPVFIPAMGLLGMLPRFILRKRGHTTAPAPIVWLLFTNWWAWLAFTVTMQDAGDSGPMKTLLGTLVPVPLSSDYQGIVFLVAIGVAITSWLAILFVAIAQPQPRPDAPTRGGAWDAVSWNAAFLLPVILVATVVLGAQLTALQTDAAGDTVSQVEALPIAAQAARAEENYTRTQQKLSEVRELIAEDGWRARDENGGWVRGAGFAPTYGGCRGTDAECYSFEAGFELEQAPAGFDPDGAEFLAELSAVGWERNERGYGFADDEGFELTVVRSPQDDRLTVGIESPDWWGDDDMLREELGESDEDRGFGEYRFDEWPPLS